MSVAIHQSAIVSPGAHVAEGASIGPFCTVGPNVTIEAGVELISHVSVDGHTRIGAGARIFPYASIGLAPQDLKYKNEPTRCEIGPRTLVREGATIHRGSVGGHGVTTLGADCMIMAMAHVAHDCTLADRVILANNVMLGGHVEIGDTVFVGGGTAVHQFVRIGRQAVIGGMSGVEADVIPYGSAMGNRARLIGLNLIGLKRRGFSRPEIHALRAMFRLLFREPGIFADRLAQALERYPGDAQVAEVLAFITAASRRGLCKAGRDTAAEDEDEAAA
ncbi:acyl-ACP--UDP-N-acetylglucosamine O-acyltransferase [Roseomonas hellenica]|uniref:Acyl-[acyl-carrier-protein]--UDP-N-acetylglucosamine O-acyltransferase n=1 Tax=Plastoroseomonas hellenica TaxID=2687306 RepID=A0ABS5F7D0_9PROT|nr:acyl-ACP--UDP-N-acetylglucosamine O-acyltransferase [Plastoroseomonas hellenica]MBR0668470.1 acyl-ACP--UDP-N-acetylglucosamine O-acyltransferase [Plastoroseomonas hellenica]